MKKINSIFLTFLIGIACLASGYYFGSKGYNVKIKTDSIPITIENKNPPENSNADMTIFWQVWDDLNKKHIDKPLNAQKLVWGATKGMVAAVGDPYTLYLNPNDNQSNDEILSGEYEGIGAELTMKDDLVTIVAPFDDSPAQKAGLKPGDKILKVNGEETYDLNLTEVVKKIKGKRGTEVTLYIGRVGEDPFDVTLTRDSITLDTVSWKEEGNGIVYIRLSRFGERSAQEWDDAVSEIIVKHPDTKTIVLDLRRNPGGFLGTAVHIASDFISKGTIVSERFSNGTENKISVDHAGVLLDKNIVVLIDEGSASASEILSGALRERADAVLVGQKSFGKGSVQEPIDYNDGSGLNVTIAKWYTPDGISIHQNGLEPDEKVEITKEDAKEGKDTQLEKAMDIAKNL